LKERFDILTSFSDDDRYTVFLETAFFFFEIAGS